MAEETDARGSYAYASYRYTDVRSTGTTVRCSLLLGRTVLCGGRPVLIMGWRGAVANLICLLAWTAPLFLLPTSVLLTTWHKGPSVILVGLAIMAASLAGPPSWHFRLGLYATLLGLSAPLNGAWGYGGALTLAILLMMVTSRPHGPETWRPQSSFYEFVAEYLDGRSYFDKCELRGALDRIPPQRVLLAAHPHGIFSAGWAWNLFWNSDLHDKAGPITFLIDEGLRLKCPTFRLLCDWYAGPKRRAGAATKKVIKQLMATGESLAILPGGFQEASICKFGVDRVYVRQRTGIVKYCLQEGYSIVPCYTFGESELYTTFTGLLGSVDLLRCPSPPCKLQSASHFE